MADTTTVRVRVTQEDIDEGVRGDCAGCPVARALLRTVPGILAAHVSTGHVDLEMYVAPDFVDIPLPSIAVTAIAEFDAGYPMSPFDFDLPLPTEPEVAARVEGEG